ncbi:MAG: hypothetical protein IBX55_10580 [Methyloprofundus sp.]|nr:hypothetical protein [Methyloprofundus sp.]
MKPLSQIISELFSFLLKASVFLLIILPFKLIFSGNNEEPSDYEKTYDYNYRSGYPNIWNEKD